MSMKLLKAAEQGDIAALELRLKDGDDIAYVQKSTGLNALITALNCGNDAAAQWLVEQGSPLDQVSLTTGMTATAWAAFNGRTEMLQALRQAGADLDKTGDDKGRTPYLIAVDHGAWEAVRWFWSTGVDLRRRDAQGRNAHDLLVQSGRDVPGDLLERTAAHAAVPPTVHGIVIVSTARLHQDAGWMRVMISEPSLSSAWNRTLSPALKEVD